MEMFRIVPHALDILFRTHYVPSPFRVEDNPAVDTRQRFLPVSIGLGEGL
jgi:hypothetical protein